MLGPIFAREALTLPRRARHYVMRTVYLGLLWVLGLTVLFLVLYLFLVHPLDLVPGLFGLLGMEDVVSAETIDRVQSYLEPYLALRDVVEPPADGSQPAYGFGLAMLGVSLLLNG